MSDTCSRCSNNLCAKKVPMFKSLSDEMIKKIIKMTGHKSYKKGDVLCHEGDIGDTLYIINEGRVKLSMINKEGKEQILHILPSGSFFGEYYLFSEDEVLNFTAYAITDLKICTLTKENMDVILEENPKVAIQLLKDISKKLTSTENLVQNLSTNDIEIRVAFVIVDLAIKYGKETEEGIEVELPISREEMAQYAGVTRETISRKLNKFIELGYLKTRGNKVLIITKIDELRDIIA